MSEAELSFDLPDGGHALFTTREHGNLSSVGGEDAREGVQRRERLRAQLGVRELLRGYQVHGTTVRRIRTPPHARAARTVAPGARPDAMRISPEEGAQIEADGQSTAVRGLGVLVLTADCLPVALGASGAVGMVHAGWRGLAAGVLEDGVDAVRELGGAGAIVAIVGPGAGSCCYEVGEEVCAAFGGAQELEHSSPRKIDLKAIARDRLLAAGVSEVRDVPVCTICDERFFSYRREGARAGRQGGVAWLS